MALNVTIAFPTPIPTPNPTPTGLTVERYELTEALSELFELTLRVTSTDASIDMRSVVGQPVVASFGDEAFLTQITGIVREARQLTSEPTGISAYELFVVPPLWLLTRRRDHRIFKKLSTDQILARVLDGYPGNVPAPGQRLSRTYPTREHTVQYGETDFDFVRRLLAEAGIAFFFDHASASAFTLVDDTTLFCVALSAPIPFVSPGNLNPQNASSPHVSAVVITSRIETSAATIRYYDFEKPRFPLEAAAPAPTTTFSNEGGLEAYAFEVGDFRAQAEADARALRLLQEARGTAHSLHCETSFSLGAGVRMTLVNHPRTDVAGDLLIVRAHTVSQAQLNSAITSHRLDAVSASEPFRVPRREKPRIAGTQTAKVVSTLDVEIDVDPYGRVLVEFPWERLNKQQGSTERRVRVSQAWAGAGYGFVTLPRVGDEVVIAYLDGDPDEPLVVGRVHNAVVATPLNLAGQQTQSVWRSRSSPGGGGYNEIRMEDAAGAEVLSVHAQRDFVQEVLRESSVTVGTHHSVTVGGNAATAVTGDQSLDIAGAYSIKAAAGIRMETNKLDIEASAFIHVTTAGERLDKSANHIIDANAVYVRGGEVVQVTGPRFHVFCDEILLKAGGSTIKLGGGGISIESDGVVDIKGALIKLNS